MKNRKSQYLNHLTALTVSNLKCHIIYFFYNCQKNVTFMHRYQVAKYVIFDSEKIFVKKFPWMLK
jgi:hypothetical protein